MWGNKKAKPLIIKENYNKAIIGSYFGFVLQSCYNDKTKKGYISVTL